MVGKFGSRHNIAPSSSSSSYLHLHFWRRERNKSMFSEGWKRLMIITECNQNEEDQFPAECGVCARTQRTGNILIKKLNDKPKKKKQKKSNQARKVAGRQSCAPYPVKSATNGKTIRTALIKRKNAKQKISTTSDDIQKSVSALITIDLFRERQESLNRIKRELNLVQI